MGLGAYAIQYKVAHHEQHNQRRGVPPVTQPHLPSRTHRGADVGRSGAAVVAAEVARRLFELRLLACVALGCRVGVAERGARAAYGAGVPCIVSSLTIQACYSYTRPRLSISPCTSCSAL